MEESELVVFYYLDGRLRRTVEYSIGTLNAHTVLLGVNKYCRAHITINQLHALLDDVDQEQLRIYRLRTDGLLIDVDNDSLPVVCGRAGAQLKVYWTSADTSPSLRLAHSAEPDHVADDVDVLTLKSEHSSQLLPLSNTHETQVSDWLSKAVQAQYSPSPPNNGTPEHNHTQTTTVFQHSTLPASTVQHGVTVTENDHTAESTGLQHDWWMLNHNQSLLSTSQTQAQWQQSPMPNAHNNNLIMNLSAPLPIMDNSFDPLLQMNTFNHNIGHRTVKNTKKPKQKAYSSVKGLRIKKQPKESVSDKVLKKAKTAAFRKERKVRAPQVECIEREQARVLLHSSTGLTVKAIAHKLDVSLRTIYRWKASFELEEKRARQNRLNSSPSMIVLE